MIFSFIGNSAFATSNAQLEQRVIQLEKQISELKKLLAQNKRQKKSNAKVDIGPSLKIESVDGSKNLQLKGLLQADAAFFKDDDNDYPDGTDFRRTRLEVRGKLSDQWDYRFEGEYAFDDAKIVNAYLRYHVNDNSLITLGQHKPLIGMEFLDNPRSRTFVETAPVVDVLAPKHRIGASYVTRGDDWLLSMGVFGEATSTQLDDDEGNYVTARGVYSPFSDTTTVHMGLSGGYHNLGSIDNVQLRSRPETRLSNNDFAIDTASISNIEDSIIIGAEFAVSYDNIYFQSEYIRRYFQRESGNDDLEFGGWYTQASWFLTGENKKYSNTNGVFNKISPKDHFSLKDGGVGAWELAARYSVLDLNDGTISGGEMKNTTLGISWYPNDYVKFTGNYIMVDTDDNASTANDEPEIFVLRSQLSF